MKIIDRYLLRQFLHVFVICFLSLNGLYAVLDAFSHLDEFLRCAENEGGLLRVLGGFYFYRSIGMFERLAGVMSLVAAMFTVTWIARHNEMTALMAAGISRARVIKPVIMACVVISLATAAGRELVIPRLREELSRDSRNLSGEQAHEFRPRVDNRTNILLRGNSAIAKERRIENASFLLPPEMAHVGAQLSSASATYEPPADGHPGGYRMKGVTEPARIAAGPSLLLDGERVIITAHDEPQWLAADECFVVSEITFDQLASGQQWRQYASTAELITGLRNPSLDFGPDVRVAIHVRLTQPLFDLTLLFLGLPIILSRESRNVFVSIGMCVGVISVYSFTVLSCQYLGTVYLLSPALAVWLPLMVYVPLAVASYDQVRR